jgi:lipoprotein NlpI
MGNNGNFGMIFFLLSLLLVYPGPPGRILAAQMDERALIERGMQLLAEGRIPESIRDFNLAAERNPTVIPHLWQRGIAYYYAGQYDEGRKQFETHRSVNPNDVENAAWWYLCMAKLGRRAEARDKLLPVGQDERIPMMQVYELYAGRATPQAVLEAITRGNPSERERKLRAFFGHLYLALYADAAGDAKTARKHLTESVKQNTGGYMLEIAKLHLRLAK